MGGLLSSAKGGVVSSVSVVALYKFVSLPDYSELRQPLLDLCLREGIRGSLLLAPEGINGTVAGSQEAIAHLMTWFESDPRFHALECKISPAENIPFLRMKVKLKKEIVTMGVPWVDPNSAVGTYVEAKDWNQLISDPDVVVVDTRNDYEYRVGTFRNAIDPNTRTFREFPQWVEENLDPAQHKKVAMFCTGGIRCEKATSYLLQQGFEEVYHLKGGVLKYLEEVPAEESLWEGDCFVFDDRVTVVHGLQRGDYVSCHACGQPLSPEEQQSEYYVREISCPYCHDSLSDEKKRRLEQRRKQIESAKMYNEKHMGRNPRERP